jgi:hypothetical protein
MWNATRRFGATGVVAQRRTPLIGAHRWAARNGSTEAHSADRWAARNGSTEVHSADRWATRNGNTEVHSADRCSSVGC